MTSITPLLLLRLGLFLTPLPSILRDDHQLASPLTSFSRCKFSRYFVLRIPFINPPTPPVKEGIYLFRTGFNPYDGGLVRHVRYYSARHIGRPLILHDLS